MYWRRRSFRTAYRHISIQLKRVSLICQLKFYEFEWFNKLTFRFNGLSIWMKLFPPEMDKLSNNCQQQVRIYSNWHSLAHLIWLLFSMHSWIKVMGIGRVRVGHKKAKANLAINKCYCWLSQCWHSSGSPLTTSNFHFNATKYPSRILCRKKNSRICIWKLHFVFLTSTLIV